MDELRPGLWRWTARHPEWEPDQPHDSPGDWPAEVGCVAYAGPDAFVLIDPLVVDDDTWRSLDERVEAHGKSVSVLRTIDWHERSCPEAIARFGATSEPPVGVKPIPIAGGETLFWIGEHRALVAGDRIIGFGATAGGLRLCPDSWLDYDAEAVEQLREDLAKLIAELPIEMVLVSHGEPVLRNGREQLAVTLA